MSDSESFEPNQAGAVVVPGAVAGRLGHLILSIFGATPRPETGDLQVDVESLMVKFPPTQPGIVLLVRMRENGTRQAFYIARDEEPCNAETIRFCGQLLRGGTE